MFRRSALSLLLHQERERRRASSQQYGGFQTPLMAEWVVEQGAAPLRVTNLRGALTPAGVTSEGVHRLGFFECELGQEDTWLANATRWAIQDHKSGASVYQTPAKAQKAMMANGLPPSHWVVGWGHLKEVAPDMTREAAEASMAVQGFVAESEGLRILAADLDVGHQVMVSVPSLAGLYLRSDDRLALALWRFNTAWSWISG